MPRALVLLMLIADASGRASAAPGGSVRGSVRVTAGGQVRPADEVVVYVTGFEEPPPAAVPEMRQHGKQFLPTLLAITAGQTVSFPNGDPFFHNVFSLSPARRFDLGQFKQGEAQAKQFPKPGVVEVYCNIHPEMAATILILPNRRFAVARSDGSFRLEGVPPGTWTIYAYDRLAERPARAEITVLPGQAAEVNLAVEETRTGGGHTNKYGDAYGPK
jgi:plastocyanin